MSKNENEDENLTLYILNTATKHMQQNFMEVYKEGSFLRLEFESLHEILKSDDLNVENEEVVFDSVRRWLSHNKLDPESHLKSLLGVVRLSLLPVEYLFDEVEPYVYPIKNCRDAFLDVLKYHILGKKKTNTRLRKYQNLSLEKKEIAENCEKKPKSTEPGMKLLSIGSDCLNTANVVEIFDDNLNQWFKPNDLTVDRRNYSVALIDDKVMLIGGTRSSDTDNEPLKMVQSLDLSTGVLSSVAALNEARQYSVAVVVGKGKMSFLYVLGGQGTEDDLDSVERWDPLLREWTHTQPMLNKRTGLAAAVLNETIFVIGGKIDIEYTNTMEVYSLEDAEWKPKASMKEARAHFCVAVFKGFLYAVAGCKEHQHHLSTVEKYDPFYDSWVTIANVLTTGHVAISSLGSRLICAGGRYSKSVFEYNDDFDKWSKLEDLHVPRSGYLLELPKNMKDLQFDWKVQTLSCSKTFLMVGNRDSEKTSTLEMYNSTEKEWIKLNNLNIDKINFSVACVGDNILMIGGVSPNGNDLNTVESLNLRTGEVSEIAPLNHHRQHSAAVVVKLGRFEIIYVFGGMRNGNPLKLVERWDTSSRTWSVMTPMTVARAGHGAVFLKNQIYVVGGNTGQNYDASMEAYDFENDCWREKASMNNKNAYFGITTFKDCIFVVGGNRNSSTSINSVERYDPARNIWTNLANISSSGTVGISVLENKLIYAGGKSSNNVEEYNETDNRWKKFTSLNNELSGFLIELRPDIEIYLSDWIVRNRSSNKLVFLDVENNDVSMNVETFDVLHKKWISVKNLPIIRKNLMVNLIDNKLLFIGGYINGSSVKTVDAFDLSYGTIESLPPLKKARYNASSVVVQEENEKVLYVLGGYDSSALSSVEIWNPSSNEWTESTSMKNTRYGHGSAFLNGKIYVVGGYVNDSISNTMEAFDVQRGGNWETKAPMKDQRYYFGITTFQNNIYVAGSFNSISSVERYNPDTDSWTTLANIKSKSEVALCSIGNRLICAGGKENHVEEYDVDNNNWVSLPPSNRKIHTGRLFQLPENAKFEN